MLDISEEEIIESITLETAIALLADKAATKKTLLLVLSSKYTIVWQCDRAIK